MAFYVDQMQKALTGRTGDWLARRAWPHLTMIVAFTLSGWAAYACSNSSVGLGRFALRFSVNFLAGYAVFAIYLACWVCFKPSLDQTALLDGAPELIETKSPWDDDATESRGQLIEQSFRAAEREGRGNGAQGLIALAIATMILGTLFVAGHMLWYARWYLGRLLILSGKIRHRTLGAAPAVAGLVAPVQLTFWTALILCVHYALLGLLLQWAFPQAVTVADIPRLNRP
jgi:hypothetical protein